MATGLGQRGEASLLWAEWFQGTVSPGPQADLVRSHPHAEVRKQVQGGEGTPPSQRVGGGAGSSDFPAP